jgi:TolB-like protein
MALAAASIAAIALGSTWWMHRESGTGPAGPTDPATAAPITVAVLPLANLSGDAAQQFFSDGMTQEISATLAKVPGLQLVARASTFRFRNSKDTRQVGADLGVRYVIDGTVRKYEDRVRITARLVATQTGKPVWSRSYERSLAGTVAVQEEIAGDIAQALKLSPGDKNLASGRDIDPASYEQFLRALPLIRARQMGVAQATEILEPLVAQNPKFAPAWALLAYAYSLRPTVLPLHGVSPYGPEGIAQRRARTEEFWPKAEAAARRAIQLDPKLPTAYLAFGAVEHFRGKLLAADDLFAKALSLDPYNPDILAWRMALLADVGRQSESLAVAQQLMALEPYVPVWKGDVAEIFWENERYDTAIQMLQSVQDLPSAASALAMVYASQGRFQEGADVLESWGKSRSEMFQGQALRFRTGAALLRLAPAKTATLPESLHLGRMSFAYLYVGAPERSLELYEDDIESGFAGGFGTSFSFLWHPSYAPARKTGRFKALMRDGGMVDYWRQRGWPSFCQPLSAQDFTCT